MGGGGGGDGTTNTNLLPSYISGLSGNAQAYLNDAQFLSHGNFHPYPGTTYAAQNANEIAGIAALATRGAYGSKIESDAETYLHLLLSGQYLSVNPNLDAVYQSNIDDIVQELNEVILPNIVDEHIFCFGGSEHNIKEAIAAERAMDTINKLTESTYYDDYRAERRIQDAGISHAIPYGERRIRDAETLRQAGIYAREYSQGNLQDLWDKWNDRLTMNVRNLDILGNAIRTILGTTRSSTTKYYTPPLFNQIAGVALAGMGMYSLWRDTTMNIYKNPAGTGKVEQPAIPTETISNQDTIEMTRNKDIQNYFTSRD